MTRDIAVIMRELLEVVLTPQYYQAYHQHKLHMEVSKFYDTEEINGTLSAEATRSRLRHAKVKEKFDTFIYDEQGQVKDYLQVLVSTCNDLTMTRGHFRGKLS